MKIIDVPVINKSSNELPTYASIEAAGMDLRADLSDLSKVKLSMATIDTVNDNSIHILPGGRALIPTGLYCKLPKGYELMVRPRSGLALKHGITVLNTPGCVDSDYTGEIGVILINTGNSAFKIEHGDRIAQAVVSPVVQVNWQEVKELEKTERGEGGFGHSGIK